MRLRSSLLILFLIGVFSLSVNAQIGINTFNKGTFTLKELLTKAKAKDANILLISSSRALPFEFLPEIKYPDSLLSKYSLVTDVFDPFLEMGSFISFRLKKYSNPGWIIVHPDNQILFYADRIQNDSHLDLALDYAETLKTDIDNAKKILDQDKNDLEGLKQMIQVLSKTFERKSINKYINRFLKQVDGRYSENLPFLIEIAGRSPGNKKLDTYLKTNKARVIKASSLSQYNGIRQKAIIAELKKREIYEPYMIWQKFEEEFGMSADSLYRFEAIKYFGLDPEAKEYQLEEIIGFLDLYPDTPWEVLDPLYEQALKTITTKEDLEIMLDLIGGQLFQGENYRKLDYRALILYRLGQKERSLKMIQEVMSFAKKEDPSYKSMIYSLNKK